MDWKGKRVVVAGRFKAMTSRELRTKLLDAGAKLQSTVYKNTDYVVLGQRAGAKEAMARTHGTTLISEAQLMALFAGEAVDLSQPAAPPPREPTEGANKVLGELRRLVYGEPSESRWLKICKALDRCDDAVLEMALDYVEQGTAAWPTAIDALEVPRGAEDRARWAAHRPGVELRAMPPKWRKALLGGQHDPRFSVARVLIFGRERVNNTLANNLLDNPHLTRLTHLRLKGYLGARFARRLAQTTHLPALTHLGMPGTRFSVADVDRVCASPLGRRLAHLSLDYSYGLGDDVPEALPASLVSLNLDSLNMWEGDRTVRWGAALRALPNLRALSVAHNRLNANGLRALLGGGLLGRLETLCLRGANLQASGVQALLELPGLENLQWLDLSGNGLNDLTGRLLKGSPRLAGLRALWVGDNP